MIEDNQSLTMRIVQTLAEQHMMTMHRACLSTMSSNPTYEAMASTKEEIHIIV
jgi:hypothetical protein